MTDSYPELYFAYINKCVKDNEVNGIDPHHYEMEWNHTLPQCLFGNQPIGQYLTLRQHAIASALQTLAFKKNCMCGWHKSHLPEQLVGLAWPYYAQMCGENGNKTVEAMNAHPNTAANRFEVAKAMLAHPNTTANRLENTKAMNDHPNTTANRSEQGKKTVEAMLAHPNTIANRKDHNDRVSKRILLTSIATGESLEFPSGREACRVLGLQQGNLYKVVAGKCKQHKGYTAVYL